MDSLRLLKILSWKADKYRMLMENSKNKGDYEDYKKDYLSCKNNYLILKNQLKHKL